MSPVWLEYTPCSPDNYSIPLLTVSRDCVKRGQRRETAVCQGTDQSLFHLSSRAQYFRRKHLTTCVMAWHVAEG